MTDYALVVPLLACLTGTGLAVGLGLSSLQGRLSARALGWLLAPAPLLAFATIASCLPAIADGGVLQLRLAWMPSLGLGASLYLDGLSALLALLVTGIGTVVVVYAGYYFDGKKGSWRFFSLLLLFMSAMLGLVLAGDVITLFVCWEGTTIVSFLLVGYDSDDPAARRGALQSLLVTASGGVALLLGLLLLRTAAGSADLPTILAGGDAVRASPLYAAILLLVGLGACTKSAQLPFHFWLPNAMTAPTPASAYLHSATMVKAGIYLLARLNPALGGTAAWFWSFTAIGGATMLMGAIVALRQRDLKAMLAYSTISQLGALTMMLGQDTAYAYKAFVIGLVAHALYKSALFLVVGIVDHAAGTRDLDRLGGLGRVMPASLAIGAVAALSMAGLPPFLGFLAKETKLATVLHHDLPRIAGMLMPTAAVIAGGFLFAIAGTLIVDTFLGVRRDDDPAHAGGHLHEAPLGMLLAPAIPTLLSLMLCLLPNPARLERFLAAAAGSAYGAPVVVSLTLWEGLTPPLLLSLVAITLGLVLFGLRRRLWLDPFPRLRFAFLYEQALRCLDAAAAQAVRIQSGHLRRYLAVMLLALGTLIALFGAFPIPTAAASVGMGWMPTLRVFAVLLAAAASAVTLVLRTDMNAVLALGASGLGVAFWMALSFAPDVALVQVVVDILVTVMLVLALARIPREQRHSAASHTFRQSRAGVLRDAILATASGAVVAAICAVALATRPRASLVTPFYEADAKIATGASDIVSAIVVDFRGFDTFIEITVFAMAGLGIFTLLHYAARTAGDPALEPALPPARPLHSLGIGGLPTSPFLRLLAVVLLPLTLVMGATNILYGHGQPGDGFTAGVIVSLALGFWTVVFGPDETVRQLPWVRPAPLIGSGLLLAAFAASLPVLLGGAFFSSVNLGDLLGLPLPHGLALGTSLLFEVAIGLTVLGSAAFMLGASGVAAGDDGLEAS